MPKRPNTKISNEEYVAEKSQFLNAHFTLEKEMNNKLLNTS
jgi:hypothetical protein